MIVTISNFVVELSNHLPKVNKDSICINQVINPGQYPSPNSSYHKLWSQSVPSFRNITWKCLEQICQLMSCLIGPLSVLSHLQYNSSYIKYLIFFTTKLSMYIPTLKHMYAFTKHAPQAKCIIMYFSENWVRVWRVNTSYIGI